MMGFDVIGDIHGQADKLFALLTKLGYAQRGSLWVPPAGRQAVFLGDLIDRGPKQLAVLDTVRNMIDAGYARSIMGNHEYNAIGYLIADPTEPGQFLRKHNTKNTDQHKEFLNQVGENSALHKEWVNWFRTLPPYLDLGPIRAVHAFWDQEHVDTVAKHCDPIHGLDERFLLASFAEPSSEWQAMESLTKGLELDLPKGCTFLDQSNNERSRIRTKWWLTHATSYRDIALMDMDQLHRIPDLPVAGHFRPKHITGSPIFVGHYLMTGTPGIQTDKVACLDYSAAKHGPLVAYRWDGEQLLDNRNFILAG